MKSHSNKTARSSKQPSAAPRARLAGRCPIVGVGASAGGLEAVTQLLKHLPVDTGFGFVLVQHLDPQHESTLTQLLARATAMPVAEVTDQLRVKANHVYVIPPNTSLGIAGGVLKLRPRSENRIAHRVIDSFFEALANDQRERAIGVILSGTAPDGTLGLEAIKAEGGLTFAQDESARFDSMPRNAVAAGCVDLALPPPAIAKELARIAKAKEILPGMQDATEVGAFQANLRRSEMRYRRLFETAQDGILILDPTTRKITDANPCIVKLLGCSRKRLLNRELWQIGLLKDKTANQEAFRQLKAKGFIRYEDLPLETAAGRRWDVEFVSNLYDEDGEAVIQCNIRDITERKRSENALIASEERFRVLFDLGPVGVYSCDARGVIQEFNQCAADLWGRKPKWGAKGERYCGSFRLRQTDGTVMPHQKCPMAAVLAGSIPEARDVEVVIERRDGSRITAIANIVPLRNARGEITGAINCFYDITARKQAEDALAAARAELTLHAAHLERMVAKRTEDLVATNRRLEASVVSNRKGKERYEALFLESQIMQRKLRNLTHQIITAQEEERKEISRELHDEVVQTLVGINVELTALGQGATDGMPAVKAKIARTQRLVEESVVAVHRFARGLRPAVLDDLGLIPALHAHCKAVAAKKNLKIQLTAFHGVESLGGAERTVLFRVAQEALTNVVRHARATEVVVTISEVAGAIRMEIQDNGAAFDVAKIFSAKAPSRLGLVGMRERIEMVGGLLVIASAPGQGTTVRAEIPFTPKKIKS
jgi:PAS domain S-box-containing protein